MNISEIAPKLRSALSSEPFILKAASVAMPIAAVLPLLAGPDSWWALVGAAVCVALLALASAQWIEAKTKALRASRVADLATKFFHVFVVFFAAIPARWAVAYATGLPPQDFDLSVALLAGFLYVPVWFAVASGVLLVVAVLQLCYSLLLLAMTMSFQHFVFTLTDERSLFRAWFVKRSDEAQRFIKLAFGTITLSAFLAAIFGTLTILVVTQSTFVRWVAFCADFQSMRSYPCLTTGQRARLHENGVVSIATPNGWDVDIGVEALDIEKCMTEHR